MSLRAILKDAAKLAFDAAGDALSAITVKAVTPGAYDPATGTQANTEATEDVRAAVKPIVDGEKSDRLENADTEFAILQAEMSLSPDLLTIIEFEGREYEVVKFVRDGVNLTWRFFARAI